MNKDQNHVAQTETNNCEIPKGSNWPIIIIGLGSFLFVVYLIYAQYKANHP